jgi:hypothetical protein
VTRRGLFGSLAAALLTLSARLRGAGEAIAAPRYGPVDVDRHCVLKARGTFLHVYHRGQDVTRRCYFADDTGDGVAKLFLHNEHGRPYLDPVTREPAKETVYGVTLVAGEPFR